MSIMMAGWEADPYFKTRLEYRLKNKTFWFDTASLLFSPFELDAGTGLLLETLADKLGPTSSILEIGCSYGAVGLTLAGLYPQAQVTLTDKDLLALRYARHNAVLNELKNVEIRASIGLDEVPEQNFEVIVSNIPAKIGDRAIEYDFVVKPVERLNAGGVYWLVAPSQLNRLLPGVARRHHLSLNEIARDAGQIVYRIKK